MGYYDLLEYWPGDCISQTRLNEKLAEMGITAGQLWDMVYESLSLIGYRLNMSSNCKKSMKQEKKLFKKFYRVLAGEFHPDINKDSGKAMVLVNKLKEQWGL